MRAFGSDTTRESLPAARIAASGMNKGAREEGRSHFRQFRFYFFTSMTAVANSFLLQLSTTLYSRFRREKKVCRRQGANERPNGNKTSDALAHRGRGFFSFAAGRASRLVFNPSHARRQLNKCKSQQPSTLQQRSALPSPTSAVILSASNPKTAPATISSATGIAWFVRHRRN